MNFEGDAIVLSGATGTKLKCEILGEYYPAWWRITSGGQKRENRISTSIIELNAGSSEDYIEETRETINGSSGHALELKFGGEDTSKLKVILVEESQECFDHLESVIRRKFRALDISKAKGPIASNDTGVYLLLKSLDEAIASIERIPLGNSLFFFDPLLYAPWSEIERVASRKIPSYYQSGTEFIVFLFTSDWFAGRPKLGLAPLPATTNPQAWSKTEEETVSEMDELFGRTTWKENILTRKSNAERIDDLVSAYRDRLHKWFRYVVPLPFRPKRSQLYHLFMCSNYELGITLTKTFYSEYTGNERYSPDNKSAYQRFVKEHSITRSSYPGNTRPLTWKILWATIKTHEEGLCDVRCDDFRQFEGSWQSRVDALEWLHAAGYLRKEEPMTDAWTSVVPMYRLDWNLIKKNLGVEPPPTLVPLEPKGLTT